MIEEYRGTGTSVSPVSQAQHISHHGHNSKRSSVVSSTIKPNLQTKVRPLNPSLWDSKYTNIYQQHCLELQEANQLKNGQKWKSGPLNINQAVWSFISQKNLSCAVYNFTRIRHHRVHLRSWHLFTSELGLLSHRSLARSSPLVLDSACSNTSTFCIRVKWS